jgi:hypothetical protein
MCQFGMESLGHWVTAVGITFLPQRVATLRRHPNPGTLKELQGFLGTVNFYRCFVKGAAHMLCPLTDILRASPPPASVVTWSEEMQRAFQTAREALARKVELVHPCPHGQLSLSVDAAADQAVGGLAGSWVLLPEALPCPGQVLSVRQGAPRLCGGYPAF